MEFSETYNRLANIFLRSFINNHPKENVVFSPYSILSLLALAANSTASETREEIVNAIPGDLSLEDINAAVNEWKRAFTEEKGFTSSDAAIIRADIKKYIRPDYKEKIQEVLGASLISEENLISAVNAWVNQGTDGMIKEIADESMKDMLACLINAVLFEAEWVEMYEEDDITEMEFSNADGTISEVSSLESSKHIYLENEFFTGFAKPYKNGFYFVGLLPKKKNSKSFIDRAIKGTDFPMLLRKAADKEVRVEMPEFSFDFQENLNTLCQELGIRRIFEDGADFSEMASADLKADSIIHKARIEVDRKGTKADAVTAMWVCAGCVPEFDFEVVTLDRPFVYAIVNNKTCLPVFMGMVNQL